MGDSHLKNILQLCKDSYNLWPENAALPAETVAEAGFVYERVQDYVRCPICRIRLFEWMPTSDPLHEHKKFSKGKCALLEYINRTQAEKENTVSSNSMPQAPPPRVPEKTSVPVQCKDVEPIDSQAEAELYHQHNAKGETQVMDSMNSFKPADRVRDYIERPELQWLLKRGANRELLEELVTIRLEKKMDVLGDMDYLMKRTMKNVYSFGRR